MRSGAASMTKSHVVEGCWKAGGRVQPADHRVRFAGRNLAKIDARSDDGFDRSSAIVERLQRYVEHARVVSGGDRRMRDPVPHRAGAQTRRFA